MSEPLVVVTCSREHWETRKAAEMAAMALVEPQLDAATQKLERGVLLAMDRGVEPVIFMLCNHPGGVYVGTQEDFDYYDVEGDCPAEVNRVPVEKEDGKYVVWSVTICMSLKPSWE